MKPEQIQSGRRRSTALPPRLRRVVEAIATGRPAKQLAGELGLSYHSFDTYRKEAYAQLGIHSAVEAANLVNGRGGPWQ